MSYCTYWLVGFKACKHIVAHARIILKQAVAIKLYEVHCQDLSFVSYTHHMQTLSNFSTSPTDF